MFEIHIILRSKRDPLTRIVTIAGGILIERIECKLLTYTRTSTHTHTHTHTCILIFNSCLRTFFKLDMCECVLCNMLSCIM